MTKPHLLVILGTRPEAIKCAPVIRACQADVDLRTEVLTTSQHRQLQDDVLRLFDIEADYDLNLMQKRSNLTRLVREAWSGISDILQTLRPDMVVCQGDTTSAFVAALAGFYQKTHLAHIEAGLRTYDKFMPFPEEGNRRMISVLADLHFAPTAWAKQNLLNEAVPVQSIYVTGNPGIDTLLTVRHQIDKSETLDNFPLQPGQRLALVTCHRRENWGDNAKAIAGGLKSLIRSFEDLQIVFLTHPNPEASTYIQQELIEASRIHLLNSVAYPQLVALLDRADIVITDSGGLQEEAPALGKPVLILREKTERPEGVQAGAAVLVGSDPRKIVREAQRLLTDNESYRQFSQPRSPYGDGRAAQRIHQAIRAFFDLGPAPVELGNGG